MSASGGRGRRGRQAAVLVALALLSACGTRLSDDAFVAAGRDPDTGETSDDALAPGEGDDTASTTTGPARAR